ncbi:MAG: hypothetical protein VW576_00180 [Opitutae bacterium]
MLYTLPQTPSKKVGMIGALADLANRMEPRIKDKVIPILEISPSAKRQSGIPAVIRVTDCLKDANALVEETVKVSVKRKIAFINLDFDNSS